MKRLLLLLMMLGSAYPAAAQQLTPPSTGGIVALDRILSHVATNKRILVIAAHPDDENNELMTLVSRGQGVDAAYLSLSRGEGGQNLIGTELGEALGVIRTGELLAARSVDGGHQYFTRDFDFGFSKSLAETDAFWPRDTSLADVLRVIRRFRPQVLVAIFSGTPRDGHGQHQQSGVVAQQAFDLLRDSAWGPSKLYRSAFIDTTRTTLRMPSGMIDPAEGKTYVQLAVQSRSQHRSQDMGAIQRLGPSMVRLSLMATRSSDAVGAGSNGGSHVESSVFEGVDTSLTPGLARFGVLVDSARAVLGPRSLPLVTDLLLRALAELRRAGPAEFRAAREPMLQEAIASAAGVVVDPAADGGWIVPGRSVNVALAVWSGGAGRARVTAAEIETPAGWSVRQVESPSPAANVPPGTPGGTGPVSAPGYELRRFQVTAAPDAPLSEPYFLQRPRNGAQYDWSATPDSLRGEPFDPPQITARVTIELGGTSLTLRREVVWRIADQANGELRRPIFVAPRVGVTVSPELLVWPSQAAAARTIMVELTHGSRDTTTGEVRLELPASWPAVAPQRFTLAGEGTRRSFSFEVRTPARLQPGADEIHAVATADGQRFDRGTATVDYPHIRPVQYTTSATSRVQVASLALPTLRAVGYVRGAADVLPEALQSIGVPLTVLTPADLELADLSHFDVIVIGSRAYEVDPALIANNARLLDYARAGGRVIVQYQQYQFIRGGFAPFPLTIANPHDRVTDENAPVRVLEPSNPVFTTPNVLGPADWQGWVQERGLYFAHTWDPAYRPLLEMGDPPVSAVQSAATAAEAVAARRQVGGAPTTSTTDAEREALQGGLLVAHLGRGLYVYTGLAFFRELPAGVPGAYRLFANLLGLEPASVP